MGNLTVRIQRSFCKLVVDDDAHDVALIKHTIDEVNHI